MDTGLYLCENYRRIIVNNYHSLNWVVKKTEQKPEVQLLLTCRVQYLISQDSKNIRLNECYLFHVSHINISNYFLFISMNGKQKDFNIYWWILLISFSDDYILKS